MSGAPNIGIRGAPGPLPEGERILWQGAPNWKILAVRALHVRKLAIYFALLLAWYTVACVTDGEAPGVVAVGVLRLGALALAPLGLILLFAWQTARSTTYTITTRRVVMRIGVALPMTLNLPYKVVNAANLKLDADGYGDVSLVPVVSSKESVRLAFPILWPHTRPWRVTRPHPTLRAIPDARRAAQILARALAASAAVPVAPVPDSQPARASQGTRAAATA